MISICLPVKNAGCGFGRWLDAWQRQRIGEEFELVAVDSGSSDETVERSRAAGARVASVPPASFNHGETRNHLARLARGETLVFTVQDAVPANERVLQELVEPLRQEPGLAGVCGVQIPDPDGDRVGRWETTQLARSVGEHRQWKRLESWDEFLTWDIARRFQSVSFDNVCSAVRRSAWERLPFSRIDFGEDLDWSLRVLRGGGALLVNPAAQVVHSHRRGPMAWLRRYFVGRRRTSHVLHMPPEHGELDDADLFRAVQRFDAQVVGFLEVPWRRTVVPTLPRLVDGLLPEKIRRPLRALGLRGLRYLVNWRSGTRPLLSLAKLWDQIVRSSGPIPPEQAPLVARQLEALILGDFLGSYYHTCEVERRVHPVLEELGRWLAAEPAHNDTYDPCELASFFGRLPAS